MPKFTGPPMDLANMRSLGVTKVDGYCGRGHQASVDVSNFPADLPRAGRSASVTLLEVRQAAN